MSEQVNDDFNFEVPQQAQPQPAATAAVQTAVADDAKPVPAEPQPEPEERPKKVFSRNDVVRTVSVNVIFPRLYPDYEPFGFKFRLKLSREAEEQRQQYLSLSAVEATETYAQQCLNEVCDLLVELPTGFSDLQDTGKSAGFSFRNYVETAPDQSARDFFDLLVVGASQAYWNAVAAHEFRPKT